MHERNSVDSFYTYASTLDIRYSNPICLLSLDG